MYKNWATFVNIHENHSKAEKKLLVSRNPGDEKNLHSGNRKFNFFIDFPEIFSFLLYLLLLFLILVFVCLFLWCFLKLKMHILIHIRLCGRVSDKNFFTRLTYLFIYLLYLTLVYKIVKNNSTNKYQQIRETRFFFFGVIKEIDRKKFSQFG